MSVSFSSVEGLVWLSGSQTLVSDSVGLITCISYKFPGDADIAGQRTVF